MSNYVLIFKFHIKYIFSFQEECFIWGPSNFISFKITFKFDNIPPCPKRASQILSYYEYYDYSIKFLPQVRFHVSRWMFQRGSLNLIPFQILLVLMPSLVSEMCISNFLLRCGFFHHWTFFVLIFVYFKFHPIFTIPMGVLFPHLSNLSLSQYNILNIAVGYSTRRCWSTTGWSKATAETYSPRVYIMPHSVDEY